MQILKDRGEEQGIEDKEVSEMNETNLPYVLAWVFVTIGGFIFVMAVRHLLIKEQEQKEREKIKKKVLWGK